MKQLTAIIYLTDTPGVFVGRIQEVRGIIAQADSEQKCFDNLVEATESMLKYAPELAGLSMKDITVTYSGHVSDILCP